MSLKDDGGNVFPLDDPDHHAFGIKNMDDLKRIQSGMSLRDYFAAKAMQGFATDGIDTWLGTESMAAGAYKWADAMLRERAK